MGSGTEVYYSANGEVIKLRDGRLVGSAGLPVDWREVRQASPPDWLTLARGRSSASEPSNYARERDVMPGYRYGLREAMTVRGIPALPRSVAGIRGDSLSWFEESSRSLDAAAALPPARFAVLVSSADARVLYSEQCLSAGVCLSFETWPPLAGAAADAEGRSR